MRRVECMLWNQHFLILDLAIQMFSFTLPPLSHTESESIG